MAVATLALLFGLFIVLRGLQPEVHRDGEGPLAATGDPRHQEAGAFDPVKGGPWTLGYPLCLMQGDQPATIDSVGPAKTVGAGFRFLGAEIRQFATARGHMPIGSVDGYPPQLPDPLQPAVGFSVSTRCTKSGLPPTYTELLIGVDRKAGGDGGGWRGIKVGYTVGGRHRAVILGFDILVCGPAVTNEPHLCPEFFAATPSATSG
ncbi:MAG TPA: hypothetical protein VIK45_17260 [Candidatus Dormibacteraeota bacterium]